MDFNGYIQQFRNEPPRLSREERARRAVAHEAAESQRTYHDEANEQFRRALAQSAAYLIAQGRQTVPHYIGLPKGSLMTGPYMASAGYTEQWQDAKGWPLEYMEWTSRNSSSRYSAFLRSDGAAIAYDRGVMGVLPIHSPAIRDDDVVPGAPIVTRNGQFYKAESWRSMWHTRVRPGMNAYADLVLQQGVLSEKRVVTDWDDERVAVRPFSEVMARFVLGRDITY